MGARVRKLVSAVVLFGAMAGGVAWFLTKPEPAARKAQAMPCSRTRMAKTGMKVLSTNSPGMPPILAEPS